jgi:hypothetical protein
MQDELKQAMARAMAYSVKVRGHDPITVTARNASAAKYAAGKAMKEAGMTRDAFSAAWHRVEWVRRAILEQETDR